MKDNFQGDDLGDSADIIPFAKDAQIVRSKVNKGLHFSKNFLTESYDDKIIDDILEEYYDIFESDLSFSEKVSLSADDKDYQKIHKDPSEMLGLHKKIEGLQRQVSDLEDEIRFYLYEIKAHMPFKK